MNEQKRTIKVRVTVMVTVDRDEYELNYGETPADAIREDIEERVVDWAREGIRQALPATASTIKAAIK